jgi:hypothetical protein
MADIVVGGIGGFVQPSNLVTKPGNVVAGSNNVILGKYNSGNGQYNIYAGHWNNIESNNNIVAGIQNTIPLSSPNTHIVGNNNTITPGSNPAAIFGSGNTITGDGTYVIGSNIIATQSNSIVTNLPIITVDINNNIINNNAVLTPVTYAQAAALIAAGGLVPSQQYIITDRGDNGIILMSVTPTQFSLTGTRLMLCPDNYLIESDTGPSGPRQWLGVWNTSMSVSINGLTIWGGLVWQNLTGSVGTATTSILLDATNWVLIPKNSFTNGEYVPLTFTVIYDFNNDFIKTQYDNWNNVIQGTLYGGTTNTIDMTDWHYNGWTGFQLTNNNCFGIYNNTTSIITYNDIPGTIDTNNSTSIFNNFTNGSISGNTNGGQISNNSNNGGISNNSNNGTINGNSNNGSISGNSNTGSINTGGINDNSNNGSISGNSNTGSVAFIISNINNGEISNNSNTGLIYNNTNNGSITNATSATTDITDPIVNK